MFLTDTANASERPASGSDSILNRLAEALLEARAREVRTFLNTLDAADSQSADEHRGAAPQPGPHPRVPPPSRLGTDIQACEHPDPVSVLGQGERAGV